MKIVIIAASVFCIALIGWGVFAATKSDSGGPRVVPIHSQYTERDEKGYWTTGTATPKVTLLEYGDYQCPGCAAMYPVLEQVAKDNADILQFQYKQYPLVDIHNKANLSARAAEAAGRQGKFWEMHQTIYANQAAWRDQLLTTFRTSLIEYAESIQLNTEQFKKDLDDSSIVDRIDKDIIDGQALPVKGTPTLVLNGVELTDFPRTAEEFNALIRAEAGKVTETSN